MEIVPTPVDEFLAGFDEDDRATMTTLDEVIVAALPGRRRVLWEGVFWGGTEQSIIGYGDIVQPRPKGPDVEWFLVGLARQKQHVSIYVNAVEDGQYLGQRYADRLGSVKIGSASIGIRRLDRVDLEALRELLALAHELAPPDRS
ncbi:MAG: DUF1801 domain-containing protein [Actinomycetota bacterium]